MLTGLRYRLAPTPAQAAVLQGWSATCRAVWNTGLAQRREYRRREAWMDYVEQAGQMAEAKIDFPWLAEPPSDVLQQTLMDLDKACRVHGVFRVRWRSKARWRPSMRLPQRKGTLAVERLGRKAGGVKIPKLGWVRLRWSRSLSGIIRSVTVGFDAGHWWISVLVQDGKAIAGTHRLPNTATGVDRGVKVAAATSGGDLYDREFVRPGEQRRMLALQRRASRQERNRRNAGTAISNRAKATRARIAKLWARVRDRRADFCQQLAHHLCRDNALIGLEALSISNMTASAAGTVEQPGTNVAQKKGLNRQILSKGWGKFELAVNSQARKTGTLVVRVNPAYTSQTCHRCKHVARDSRESQAVFRCFACGWTCHADVNAACNILAAALAATGRDGPSPPDINGRVSHQRSPLLPRQPTVSAAGRAEIFALLGGEDVKAPPSLGPDARPECPRPGSGRGPW